MYLHVLVRLTLCESHRAELIPYQLYQYAKLSILWFM